MKPRVMNAADVIKALGGRNGTARCPAHEDRNPSFSVSDAPGGGLLVHCHAGCSQVAVIDALRSRGLWPAREPPRAPAREARPQDAFSERPAAKRDDGAGRSEAARVIWRAARPVADTPAEAYLRERGLRPGPEGWPPTLRYHSGLKHGPTGLVLSAIVVAVARWPSTTVSAVQRIFLRAGSGDRVTAVTPKMTLGALRGGAVRLAAAGETLALAEGVETALAVQQATGLPTWATLGTSNFKYLKLPDVVRTLIIAADGDNAGRATAAAAAGDWARQGLDVRVADPGDGLDFNDVLVRS